MLCDFKITINRIEALVRQLEKEEGREKEKEKKEKLYERNRSRFNNRG